VATVHRNAPPVVAVARGDARYATMLAISAGSISLCNKDCGAVSDTP
jgi:hypothetical protein